jgi:ABC-type polysaccharide/polyol phosphate export permease
VTGGGEIALVIVVWVALAVVVPLAGYVASIVWHRFRDSDK